MTVRDVLKHRRAAETFNVEHGGKAGMFHVTLGRYADGRIGEVFISGAKAGSDVEAVTRDGAVLISIALQHGVPIATMAAAITREGDGTASTIIGRVLEEIAKSERQ